MHLTHFQSILKVEPYYTTIAIKNYRKTFCFAPFSSEFLSPFTFGL